MGVQFLFDTGSQHFFSAPQGVLYQTDGQMLSTTGFNVVIHVVPVVSSGNPMVPFNGLIQFGAYDNSSTQNNTGIVAGSDISNEWWSTGNNAQLYGSHNTVKLINGGNTGQIVGGLNTIFVTGAGPVTAVRGTRSDITVNGPASIATLEGSLVTIQKSDVTVALGIVYGYRAIVNVGAGPQTPTATAYRVDSIAGNVDTTIGLDIANQVAGAVANYAIRTGTGKVSLGDQVSAPCYNLNRVTFSNAAFNVLASHGLVVQIGAMTASRAVNLPLCALVTPGHIVTIVDESGTVGAVNTLVVTQTGGATINGAATQTILSAYGTLKLMCDGVSKWTIVP